MSVKLTVLLGGGASHAFVSATQRASAGAQGAGTPPTATTPPLPPLPGLLGELADADDEDDPGCDVCHEPLGDGCACQNSYAREHDSYYAER